MNERFAAGLLEALQRRPQADRSTIEPSQDSRPTPEQKALIERLNKVVDARAAELQVSAEVLAPRGELKALAMGKRDIAGPPGWRREEIGDRCLTAMSAERRRRSLRSPYAGLRPRSSNALEHRLHVGIRVDDPQQAGRSCST